MAHILHGVEDDQETSSHKANAVVFRVAKDDLLLAEVAEEDALEQMGTDVFPEQRVFLPGGCVALQQRGDRGGHLIIFVPG